MTRARALGNDGSPLRALLAIAAIGALGFVLLLLRVDGSGPLAPLDSQPRAAARDLGPTAAADVAALITILGSLPVVAAAVIAGAALLALDRRPGAALALALGFLTVVLSVHLIKAGVARMRPPGASASLTTASFPSGHAAYAMTYVALALALAGFRDLARTKRAAAVSVGVALTFLVGLTRVLLDVHYVSDVVAGWALSAAIFALAAAFTIVVARMRNTDPPSGTSSAEGSSARP